MKNTPIEHVDSGLVGPVYGSHLLLTQVFLAAEIL